jgi:hypothetical protein
MAVITPFVLTPATASTTTLPTQFDSPAPTLQDNNYLETEDWRIAIYVLILVLFVAWFILCCNSCHVRRESRARRRRNRRRTVHWAPMPSSLTDSSSSFEVVEVEVRQPGDRRPGVRVAEPEMPVPEPRVVESGIRVEEIRVPEAAANPDRQVRYWRAVPHYDEAEDH